MNEDQHQIAIIKENAIRMRKFQSYKFVFIWIVTFLLNNNDFFFSPQKKKNNDYN